MKSQIVILLLALMGEADSVRAISMKRCDEVKTMDKWNQIGRGRKLVHEFPPHYCTPYHETILKQFSRYFHYF